VLARLTRVVESALGDDDLSLSQYRLLAFLAQGDWAASVLADRLNVSRPSITGLVDGLVKRGLVERRPSADDRRRIDHVLTDAGRRTLVEADERADARLRKLLAEVPTAVADDVLDALSRLHAALDLRLQEKLR
jgi:long-chain acyl-CoA synthetase